MQWTEPPEVDREGGRSPRPVRILTGTCVSEPKFGEKAQSGCARRCLRLAKIPRHVAQATRPGPPRTQAPRGGFAPVPPRNPVQVDLVEMSAPRQTTQRAGALGTHMDAALGVSRAPTSPDGCAHPRRGDDGVVATPAARSARASANSDRQGGRKTATATPAPPLPAAATAGASAGRTKGEVGRARATAPGLGHRTPALPKVMRWHHNGGGAGPGHRRVAGRRRAGRPGHPCVAQ